MIWFYIVGFIPFTIGCIYFSFFFYRLVKELVKKPLKIYHKVIISIIVIIVSLPAIKSYTLYGKVYLHLLAVTIVFEIIYHFFKNKYFKRIFISGVLSIILVCGEFGFGYYQMHHVVKTTYKVKSKKDVKLKVLLIADLHLGNSIDDKDLVKYVKEMNKTNPDIVVLDGDIFDENTTKQEMINGCAAFSKFKSKKGVYYVFGNHDQATYTRTPPFTSQEIIRNLEKNNVTVLQDEAIDLGSYTLIGRKDASFMGDAPRKSVKEIIKDEKVDLDDYVIILDHQPRDLEINADSQVDLQLSGHTHGGQTFPEGQLEALFSSTLMWGERDIKDFKAITTTGISGWGFPFKSGNKAEYCLIKINE